MFRTNFCSDRISTARLGALGLAAVLVLGGCSGSGDDPGAEAAERSNRAAASGSASAGGDATEFASASPTPTPTPTAAAYKPASAEGPAENVPLPAMPEVGREKSKEGLEAFARYWFDLINYGYETGDISLAQGLSGPECEICQSFYGAMEKGHVGEDWVDGGKLAIVALGTSFVETPQGRFQVILSVKQDASVNRGPNGKIFGEVPADEYSFGQIMEASYVGDHWVVDLVDNL